MNAWTEYNGEGGSDVQPVRASGMRGEGVGKDACTNTHTHAHTQTRVPWPGCVIFVTMLAHLAQVTRSILYRPARLHIRSTMAGSSTMSDEAAKTYGQYLRKKYVASGHFKEEGDELMKIIVDNENELMKKNEHENPQEVQTDWMHTVTVEARSDRENERKRKPSNIIAKLLAASREMEEKDDNELAVSDRENEPRNKITELLGVSREMEEKDGNDDAEPVEAWKDELVEGWQQWNDRESERKRKIREKIATILKMNEFNDDSEPTEPENVDDETEMVTKRTKTMDKHNDTEPAENANEIQHVDDETEMMRKRLKTMHLHHEAEPAENANEMQNVDNETEMMRKKLKTMHLHHEAEPAENENSLDEIEMHLKGEDEERRKQRMRERRKRWREERRVEEKPMPGYGVLCPNCDAECPRLQDEIHICINPHCWVQKYDPTHATPLLDGSSSNVMLPTSATWIARHGARPCRFYGDGYVHMTTMEDFTSSCSRYYESSQLHT